ncbi:MAG: HIT domain-containing protein [Rickettsiales bacterium]|jgi:diadenosine tetraphosphate (Ap4A) HIT family hydrolase|nr:HIT domain-containing protein [Rickettsiales bacterium]
MYDKNNVFGKIIRGEIPCAKVLETRHSLAFKDANPTAKTHILVIPKGGYENIADFISRAPDEEKRDFWNAVLAVAEGAGVGDCFRAAANTGAGAGQSVMHFHVHILSDK